MPYSVGATVPQPGDALTLHPETTTSKFTVQFSTVQNSSVQFRTIQFSSQQASSGQVLDKFWREERERFQFMAMQAESHGIAKTTSPEEGKKSGSVSRSWPCMRNSTA